jgi:hypothetical protein
MANLTATLYITIKTKAGKWTTVKPAMSDNGRLKKLVAVVDGKEEKHPEGQYKVRWLESGKPRFDSVGNDPDAALMALNRREKALAAIAAGVEVKNTDGKQRYRITDAAAQYLAFVKENHSHKTWLAYSRNIKLFQIPAPRPFWIRSTGLMSSNSSPRAASKFRHVLASLWATGRSTTSFRT